MQYFTCKQHAVPVLNNIPYEHIEKCTACLLHWTISRCCDAAITRDGSMCRRAASVQVPSTYAVAAAVNSRSIAKYVTLVDSKV